MKNVMKEKMESGKKVLGTFLWMGGASTVEALGYSGLDFVIIDNEHGPYTIENTQEMCRVADLSQITPCVRITEVTRSNVLRQLDVGAEAIIVPDIKTIDEVKNLIRYAKYFPLGERGLAFARKAGYGYSEKAKAGLEIYTENCNKETLIFPQCETKECVDIIEDIVALDGVDGIFVGPYDLSASLGMPGDFENPKFQEAIEKVCKATKEAGKYLMIFSFDKDQSKDYLECADAVVYSSDVNLMVDSFQRDVKDILG